MDELPLSRPKKHIARDFADGGETPAHHTETQAETAYAATLVITKDQHSLMRTLAGSQSEYTYTLPAVLVAEVVNHEAPRIVEVHNYSSANGVPQRM